MKDHLDYTDMPEGYHDGWNRWNPYGSRCLTCGSDKMEFYWEGGEVEAIRCLDCGEEEYGK